MSASDSAMRAPGHHRRWLLVAVVTMVTAPAAVVALGPTIDRWASSLYSASHGSAATVAGFSITATALIIGITSFVGVLCQRSAPPVEREASARATTSADRPTAGPAKNSSGFWTLLDASRGADVDEPVDTSHESLRR